ncbi:MAG: UDP-3-O-(3-hydroxymyristoyl)glucosamine N-acyltransferase [Bacteroidota bacterium]
MQVKAIEIAHLLNGAVEGDPNTQVNRPSKIEEGGVGSISFLGNEKYEPFAYTTDASILLVPSNWVPKQPVRSTLIKVDDVYASVAILFKHFGQQLQPNQQSGIHTSAIVHSSANVHESVSVGAQSIIEANAQIGKNSKIGAQVYIGAEVTIGANCTIHPGARILHRCEIGNHCIIHPNTVIGSDGFGFAPQADGSYQRIEQLGIVKIEDDVEIGSNCSIDRATLGATLIRKGAKLDNLIQIAHNVEIGENTVLAAQVGVAGSTKIGKNCQIGGQVGFVGHVTIADGTKIQAQSGIASAVKKENQALFGSPAFGYNDFLRSYTIFKKLPELYKKLSRLEKTIKEK